MALPAYRVAKTLSGNSPPTELHRAGGTCVAGQFVSIQPDGDVNPSGDDNVLLFGIATNDAVSGEDVGVILNTADVIFSANVEDGSYSAVQRGSLFDMKIIGVALNETGTPAFVIMDVDPTDPTRVLLSVLNTTSTAPGGTANHPG